MRQYFPRASLLDTRFKPLVHRGRRPAGFIAIVSPYLLEDEFEFPLLVDQDPRGLLKDTLVIWGGEFRCTPQSPIGNRRNLNNRGYTLWIADRGVKGGMSGGAIDDSGGSAVEAHVHDLHATPLALLGLDHKKLTFRYAGHLPLEGCAATS